MNRVVIKLTKNGEFDGVCSDEPVEVFVVDPNCGADRVYLYGAAEIGPQHVRREIGGYAVGHAEDGTLGDFTAPKLPPSERKLRLIGIE